ncbi:Transforming growth factor beta-1-induced transcript 1 protein [Dermatophagoides farinae]|uniref:Paxillin-like protein n=1 Tax=Dermatophagoides farinae TaxID=6954 RepID=A0A922HNP2_DERFA|nr:paxillin-like isoform X1 [Dermatophagoides farinae]KAH7645165.1 paxillin-like protein [Dermatophagoides farinae]KAH9498066.1 Transforming growth factor beta-1-induced transcript 1 protein [Dermatophagoides farinae]
MYRKKGMERIQDSLLQDLERATSTLKTHPIGGSGGGTWKLSKPHDPTISSQPAYSTAKVAKHYSPQYYVNDEPLYQNEQMLARGSADHDYAPINGRNGTSPIYEGIYSTTTTTTTKNNHNQPNSTDGDVDVITEKISMINNLLDDLDAARLSYELNGSKASAESGRHGHHHNRSLERQANSNAAITNGATSPYLTNGNASRQQRERSTDSDQVNDLIRNLEYNLQNATTSPSSSSSAYNKPSINGGVGGTTTVMYDDGGNRPQQARIEPVSEYNRQLVNITPQKAQMNENPVIQVPLPSGGHGPVSHATRELDDLMASLSDFKLNQIKTTATTNKANYMALGKIQVPNKGYAPILSADLDSMIGNLEIDLNKQGVSTATKGDCQACGRAIIGQVVTALGTTWHPEHFVCAKCQQQLGDSTFFERDGVAYCEQDYHRLFSPKCHYCNKPIYDRCITALDKTWHPEHFCCSHCGKNFGDEGYHEKAGNAYCREDFFKLFAPKCSGCAKPIEDNYVTALGGQWHQDCFVCRDCKSPFTEGKSYFDFEGRPYCEPHYHDKRGNLCASCRQPITGRCITAMFQKYHPEHFTCSFCLKQLNKGTFKKHNEKPYCHSCFDKLFA